MRRICWAACWIPPELRGAATPIVTAGRTAQDGLGGEHDPHQRVLEIVRHEREHVLARGDRPLRLPVEARVLHRHRRVRREIAHRQHVGVRVAPARRAQDERQHAQHIGAADDRTADDRHVHDRSRRRADDEGVVAPLRPHRGVRHRLEQQRLARTQHARESAAVRRARRGGAEQRDLLGLEIVGEGGLQPAEPARGVDDVEDADLRDGRDREVRDLDQGCGSRRRTIPAIRLAWLRKVSLSRDHFSAEMSTRMRLAADRCGVVVQDRDTRYLRGHLGAAAHGEC